MPITEQPTNFPEVRPLNRRPLKIGWVTPMHHPVAPPFKGGIETAAWYGTSLLAAYGHEVYLFQRGNRAPENIHNIQFDSPHMYDDEHIFAGAITRFAEAADLDVLINVSWLESLLHLNMAGYGPPQVVWLMHPFGFSPAFTQTLQRLSTWPKKRFTVIAQTRTQAEDYILGNIAINGYGMTVPLNPTIYSYLDKTTAFEKTKHLLWAGRPAYEKGADLAIRAAKLVNMPITLFLTEKDGGYLEDLAKAENAEAEFIYTAPQNRLHSSLKDAACLLMPNRAYALDGQPWQEPGSCLAMESLLLGVPIVGSYNGCLKDWIENGVNGVLIENPEDIGNLASAIDEVDEMQYLHSNARNNIQHVAFAQWGPEPVYERLIHAIQEACRTNPKHRF